MWKTINLSSSLLTVIENIEYPGSLSKQGFPFLITNYGKGGKKIKNERTFWESLKPSKSEYHPEIESLLIKQGLTVIPEYIVPLENHDLWELLGGPRTQSSIRFDWWASGNDIENDHNKAEHLKSLDNIRDRYTMSLGIPVTRITCRSDYTKLESLREIHSEETFRKNNAWLWWANYQDVLVFIDWFFMTYGFPNGPYRDGTYRITYKQILEGMSGKVPGKFCKIGPWKQGSDEDWFIGKLKRVLAILFQVDLTVKDSLLELESP